MEEWDLAEEFFQDPSWRMKKRTKGQQGSFMNSCRSSLLSNYISFSLLGLPLGGRIIPSRRVVLTRMVIPTFPD